MKTHILLTILTVDPLQPKMQWCKHSVQVSRIRHAKPYFAVGNSYEIRSLVKCSDDLTLECKETPEEIQALIDAGGNT